MQNVYFSNTATDLVSRIRSLTSAVSNLSSFIKVQNTKIQILECKISEINESCDANISSKRSGQLRHPIDANIISKGL